MTERPPVEPRRLAEETRKDRRRQWYVGIGAVIALLSLIGCVLLTFQVHRDQVAIKTEQTAVNTKDAQIVKLLEQHSATFQRQAKTDAQTKVFLQDLGILATYLIESNEAVCVASHAACPTLPPIPKIPGT